MNWKKKKFPRLYTNISSRHSPRFTWYCTHFLKIGFVVAGGVLYSYYIHKGNKSDKKKNCKKSVKFYAYKKIFLKMGAIPCGCNSTSTHAILSYNIFKKVFGLKYPTSHTHHSHFYFLYQVIFHIRSFKIQL